MAQHELKTVSPHFEAVRDGCKTFEVRRADRNFRVGDVLLLQHYDRDRQRYLGSEVRRRVIYVLKGIESSSCDYVGIAEGFVAMGLATEVVAL